MTPQPLYLDKIESLATGRQCSLFEGEMNSRKQELTQCLKKSRVAVIGAAGSIGSEVVKLLTHFPLAKISLFDISENNLVEVVRTLRSSKKLNSETEIEALPLGMGEPEFDQYFRGEKFDFILNFSAMKHVRSEKDVFCLNRMLRVNVVSLYQLMKTRPKSCQRFFSVSSDKAVRPSNLMGASKNLMEQALLYGVEESVSVSSARFANVAFSDGSLPSGFIKRFEKNQPLAAPSDIKRYFISHQEAAELSILAAFTGKDAEVFLPRQNGNLPEVSFSDIAIRFLEFKGYTPVECYSDAEARDRIDELIPQKKWPCFFSLSNTTGEKKLEEFKGEHDCNVEYSELKNIEVVKRLRSEREKTSFEELMSVLTDGSSIDLTKSDLVHKISQAVPDLRHTELNKNLDSKM